MMFWIFYRRSLVKNGKIQLLAGENMQRWDEQKNVFFFIKVEIWHSILYQEACIACFIFIRLIGEIKKIIGSNFQIKKKIFWSQS